MKLLIIILLISLRLSAQNVHAVLVDGDTLPTVYLKTVVIIDEHKNFWKRNEWNRLVRNVKKTYPMSKIVKQKLNEYLSLTEGKNHVENQFLKSRYEKELKVEFEKDIRDFTNTQGIILVKLIDRETSKTSYQLIKELKSGFSAFMWQSVIRLFGGNLKEKYDPINNEDDRKIENIIEMIDRGEL